MLLRVLCLMHEQAFYTLPRLKSGHDTLNPVSHKAQILQFVFYTRFGNEIAAMFFGV
jgi:hypothetical protein